MTLPYTKKFSEKTASSLRNMKVDVIPRISNCLRNIVKKGKTKVDGLQKKTSFTKLLAKIEPRLM